MSGELTGFDTVAVIGTGLLGGSVAAALRGARLARRIVGVDTDPSRLTEARDLGLIDDIADEPVPCNLAIVAVPGPVIARVVVDWADHAGLLIDVGSVKAAVTDAAVGIAHFVPCHPMAGSERAGPSAARADLFDSQSVIVTPTQDTSTEAVDRVSTLWARFGASVHRMTPQAHDEAVAITSHLPHLLAFTFAGLVEPEHLPVTGPGFRDFTRIAQSNPGVWSRILRFNRQHLLADTDRYLNELQAARDALADSDDGFAQWLTPRTKRRLR